MPFLNIKKYTEWTNDFIIKFLEDCLIEIPDLKQIYNRISIFVNCPYHSFFRLQRFWIFMQKIKHDYNKQGSEKVLH